MTNFNLKLWQVKVELEPAIFDHLSYLSFGGKILVC